MTNAYEEKLESRRERLLERSDKADAAADVAGAAARATADVIPLGQPILVGHHSERRHRRDLDRIDAGYRKAHEGHKHAEALRVRAAKVGKGGVSSDDPQAIAKLRAKAVRLEEARDRMKRANIAYRRSGWEGVAEVLGQQLADRCRAGMSRWDRQPIPSYALTNAGAEIRRVRKRIEQLQLDAQRADEPAEDLEGDGFRVVERPDLNRITIEFEGKPAAEVRQVLKSSGWRWSPRNGCWQRHLNDAGRQSAVRFAVAMAGGSE